MNNFFSCGREPVSECSEEMGFGPLSPLGDPYPLRVQVELVTPPLNLLLDLGEVGRGSAESALGMNSWKLEKIISSLLLFRLSYSL